MIAAEAHAGIDLPPFDRTAMDGYAVRAADVSPGAELRVIGDLAAGGGSVTLEPGTAARISTGAAIPPGADAILRVEDADGARRDRGRRPRASRTACTSAAAPRTCTPATCSPAPATC